MAFDFSTTMGVAGASGRIRQYWESYCLPMRNHPNVGGITILSLGCQHLQSGDLVEDIRKADPSFDKPLYVFEQQQSQSEENLIQEAIRKTFEGLVAINRLEKKTSLPGSNSRWE